MTSLAAQSERERVGGRELESRIARKHGRAGADGGRHGQARRASVDEIIEFARHALGGVASERAAPHAAIEDCEQFRFRPMTNKEQVGLPAQPMKGPRRMRVGKKQ